MPDNKGNGWNWIRPEKRFAIYHRDNFTCAWCGVQRNPPGYGLTLDHLRGSDNDARNLITACNTCNAARGKKTLRQWGRRRPRTDKKLDKEMGRQLAAMRRIARAHDTTGTGPCTGSRAVAGDAERRPPDGGGAPGGSCGGVRTPSRAGRGDPRQPGSHSVLTPTRYESAAKLAEERVKMAQSVS